jgi:hypothetical protein
MFRYLLSFLILILPSVLFGQNAFKKNDLYFEFLGNGIWSSISYEHQLKNSPGWGLRFGVGYFSGDEVFRITIPVGVHYLFQLKNEQSFLDAGVGTTWSNAAGIKPDVPTGERDYGEHIWSLVPSIGYRHHTRGNFMWRASITPVINKYRFIPYNIGLSVGKRF